MSCKFCFIERLVFLGRPIKIDLAIKLLPNSRRASRHSRLAPMPVRGTRAGGYGTYLYYNVIFFIEKSQLNAV